MKLWIVAILAATALYCGLRAARLWRDSTSVPLEPEGFEPVDLDMRRIYWDLARYKLSDRVNELNRNAAWWTKATAIAGFVGAIVGMWPN